MQDKQGKLYLKHILFTLIMCSDDENELEPFYYLTDYNKFFIVCELSIAVPHFLVYLNLPSSINNISSLK